ncbi:Zn-dependent exopeptidase [Xylaria bambusicola]|uniref:Zn-dependent exopeptidase n=1 Tax=Xylaria bambusicola TaxID=326684 RepID=UPI0020086A15|nr:Zn-dependent exopeptidase [Xylaria bambusicola]KAI0515141.1 Zn-dependent exopeptidase [Xylaria bambusicola]
MVGVSRLAVLGAILPAALAAVRSEGRPILGQRVDGLRLVKTSEEDAGTWMTEEEKFEKLTSKRIGFMDITDTMELEAMGEARRAARAQQKAAAFPSGPSHQTEANALIAKVKQSNLQTWTNTLADFYNRYYRGSYAATSASWMYSTVVSVASANSAIKVKQFTHSYNQPSVIATIPGSSAEVVVVSAHYDSVGSTTSGRAPGADDNASGVVVVLEALRVLAEAKYAPENTLEFHFYSGEEGGLLGSRDVFNSYARSRVNVLAVMNQDMTGYSPNNVIAVFTDYGDTNLINFTKKLVPVYSKLPLSTDRCGYGCSDHASAYSAGYPAVYVCDENIRDSSPYIHSAQDTVSTVNFPHVLEHAKLTVGFLVEASYF